MPCLPLRRGEATSTRTFPCLGPFIQLLPSSWVIISASFSPCPSPQTWQSRCRRHFQELLRCMNFPEEALSGWLYQMTPFGTAPVVLEHCGRGQSVAEIVCTKWSAFLKYCANRRARPGRRNLLIPLFIPPRTAPYRYPPPPVHIHSCGGETERKAKRGSTGRSAGGGRWPGVAHGDWAMTA